MKDTSKRIIWDQAIELSEKLYHDGKFKQAAFLRANLYLGLRVGDFQNFVTWGIQDKQTFTCIPQKTSKRKKVCTRPINQDLKSFLEKCWIAQGYPEKTLPIWDNGRKDISLLKPATEQSINKTMKRWIALYDLRDSAGNEIEDKHFSTHSIRKTAAWKVYEATGFNIMAAKKYLLHDSVETTKKYLGIEEKEMIDMLSSIY